VYIVYTFTKKIDYMWLLVRVVHMFFCVHVLRRWTFAKFADLQFWTTSRNLKAVERVVISWRLSGAWLWIFIFFWWISEHSPTIEPLIHHPKEYTEPPGDGISGVPGCQVFDSHEEPREIGKAMRFGGGGLGDFRNKKIASCKIRKKTMAKLCFYLCGVTLYRLYIDSI